MEEYLLSTYYALTLGLSTLYVPYHLILTINLRDQAHFNPLRKRRPREVKQLTQEVA